jgi:quercetin dioxygenase-like cupin family protein
MLEGEGTPPRRLEQGDAFVIPPGMRTLYAAPTDDLELLEVALPGRFRTVH